MVCIQRTPTFTDYRAGAEPGPALMTHGAVIAREYGLPAKNQYAHASFIPTQMCARRESSISKRRPVNLRIWFAIEILSKTQHHGFPRHSRTEKPVAVLQVRDVLNDFPTLLWSALALGAVARIRPLP